MQVGVFGYRHGQRKKLTCQVDQARDIRSKNHAPPAAVIDELNSVREVNACREFGVGFVNVFQSCSQRFPYPMCSAFSVFWH